ncbi:hypothetical protein H6S82_26375 [Planktothrix sp. FACHB-1355]|uniref:Metal-dependent hydrolase n=1 Tax=Aerosakkonema funiforme FACHB-1375 TaxID=2949571 RepID=A0A926VK46_9CYAN|nr:MULTISPECIES: hypothetical protein [Oscillatoriales]MBD2184728.1 hypothetical protein [Aerosakkonema funiforme FACHB-1375]MBD3562337.1 hypothetical protein [Planktothrix sp. FACHB-1355]
MNTPSHAILNLFFLGKKSLPEANLTIFIGAILPDIPIFVLYGWAKLIARLPEKQIWSEVYYQAFWQNIVALFHSIPLAFLGWFIAYKLGWQKVQILCISMVLHSLFDLPVHNDDAHRHFFPFSNYRFISPISYWDKKHYGGIVSVVEISLVLLASFPVFNLLQSWIGKGLLIAIDLVYLYFFLRS